MCSDVIYWKGSVVDEILSAKRSTYGAVLCVQYRSQYLTHKGEKVSQALAWNQVASKGRNPSPIQHSTCSCLTSWIVLISSNKTCLVWKVGRLALCTAGDRNGEYSWFVRAVMVEHLTVVLCGGSTVKCFRTRAYMVTLVQPLRSAISIIAAFWVEGIGENFTFSA